MSKIVFSGFGSNSFSALNTVSFIYDNGHEKMLVDCGASALYNIHATVSSLCDISYCFISHSHFDHFLGLPYFIIGRNLDAIARKKSNPDYIAPDLTVFIQKGLSDSVMSLLSLCHPDVKKLNFNVKFVELTDSLNYVGEHFRVTAQSVNHSVTTYAMTIYEGTNKVLSYSSDTLYSDSIIEFLRGAKTAIIEGMVPDDQQAFSLKAKHATFSDAINASKKIGAERTIVVHLQPRYYSQLEAINDMLKANGNINFPKPGEWYEV